MSIIHNALKKVQQGQEPMSDKSPASKPPESGYIYANSPGLPRQEDEQPIENLPSKQNKARSVLAFLCALAIILGAFVFLYKQLCTYFPKFKDWTVLSFNNLTHKKIQIDFKTTASEDLKPLAKIIVNPPKPLSPPKLTNAPKPTNTPGPTDMPASASTVKPVVPTTLNVHGVMSNGHNSLVLINDQVYQEGDEIDGVKIVKINLKSITVINNGKEESIHVKN
jgi:hypothetical protein